MASERKHILILRFSALGDVAILAPLLRVKMPLNPDVQVTVAAPAMLEPLFRDIPGVSFIGVDKHKSVLKIFRTLLSIHPTVIADLHSVIRTIFLDFLFLLHFVPVKVLIKQRKKRRRLLKTKDVRLAPSWRLYDYVLGKCGMKGVVENAPVIVPKKSKDGILRVGLAPFSTSMGKDWPVEKMEKLLEMFSAESNVRLYFFGGKKYKSVLDVWMHKFPNSETVIGRDFSEELDIIRTLNVMVSMDSANVHFASAVGVPAVTIWGATHPYCGFSGWGQNEKWSVQAEMSCRPCSIYGGKPCDKETYECLDAIHPQQVYDIIMEILHHC